MEMIQNSGWREKMRLAELIILKQYCKEQLYDREIQNNPKRRTQLREIAADVDAAILLEEQNYKVTWDLKD